MGSLRIVVVACVALLALLLWQAVPQPAAPAGSRAGPPAAAARGPWRRPAGAQAGRR